MFYVYITLFVYSKVYILIYIYIYTFLWQLFCVSDEELEMEETSHVVLFQIKRDETEGERVIEMKESVSDRRKERKHVNAHEALE